MLLDFGEHAGSYLADCPCDYIEWVARRPRLRGNPSIPRIARGILQARGLPVPAPSSTPLTLQQAKALAAIASNQAQEKYERAAAHYILPGKSILRIVFVLYCERDLACCGVKSCVQILKA